MASQLDVHWIEYRNFSDDCTARVRKGRNNRFTNLFGLFDEKRNTKQLDQATKNQLGWETGGAPKSFLMDGKPQNVPQKLTNICTNSLFLFNKLIYTAKGTLCIFARKDKGVLSVS